MGSIEGRDGAKPAVSHWFLRYEVDRKDKNAFLAGSWYMVASSRSTLDLVRERHNEISFEIKVSELQQFHNTEKNIDSLQREWLEDVFSVHATSTTGLKWFLFERFRQDQKDQVQVEIKLDKLIEGECVPFERMEEKTLYVKINPQFPFVDGVWKTDGKLFAFQATTGTSHPKEVKTWKSALEKLKINKEMLSGMEVTIYYVVMPRVFADKCKLGKDINPSFFWKNVDNPEIKEYSENMKFILLSPPEDFGTGYDKE